jgi:hypothetical protein
MDQNQPRQAVPETTISKIIRAKWIGDIIQAVAVGRSKGLQV